MIDGHTGVLAVIGDPITHTLSPILQRLFIGHTGLNLTYVPLHVRPEGLKKACEGAWNLHIRGINVTIPHKQKVMECCVSVSREAALVGAVNTLQWTEKGYVGYNTDLYGFGRQVADHGVCLRGEKVLVIGAGGASNSAVALAVREEADEIVVLNRTEEKARQMLESFRARAAENGYPFPRCRTATMDEVLHEEFPIVFQTTSVGMSPNTEASVIEDERFFARVRHVFDMVYTPFTTRFCALAKAAGADCVGGLTMLFHQGLKSFSIWTGREFTPEEEEKLFRQFASEMEKREHE